MRILGQHKDSNIGQLRWRTAKCVVQDSADADASLLMDRSGD